MTSFAFIQSLLVLYCTSSLQFNDANAYALYAAYGSLVFGVPLLGGYLGGNVLGYKSAVQTGLFLSLLGLIGLTLPDKSILFLALSCFVMGTSLTIPNIYCLISQLYGPKNNKRESGFTLSYMGMNFGGFFAMAASGFIQLRYGFHIDFLLGAIGICLAIAVFMRQKKYFIDNKLLHSNTAQKTRGYLLTLLTIPLWMVLLKNTSLCNILLISAGIGALLYGAYVTAYQKGPAKQKMIVFLVLLIICLVFWSLYSLSPTALTIFIERNVNRHFFDSIIPTSSIMSLNPFFIVTVGYVFNLVYLRSKKKTMSIPAKIATGIVLMGAGYLALDLGIHEAMLYTGFTALSWIVISYFLQTTGELFVGPIGFAMVGSLVPTRFEGIMMGMWQLCVGVSSIVSGYLAKSTAVDNHITNPVQTNPIYAHAFNHFGSIAISIGLLMGIVIILKKHGLKSKEDDYGESFS